MRTLNIRGHLQTVLPSIIPYNKLELTSELVELADGDFLLLHYPTMPRAGRTILLVHGMGGNRFSPIVHNKAKQLFRNGFTPVIAELRASTDMPNRTEKFFNAGSISDFEQLVSFVTCKIGSPLESIFAVSLGANLTLNWSAMSDSVRCQVKKIHCVGLPLDLRLTARMANVGFNRVYQKIVFTKYKNALLQRDCELTKKIFPTLKSISTMLEFDEHVTVPLNGYRDLADYYKNYSAMANMKDVQVSCTITNSTNDPLVPICRRHNKIGSLSNIHLQLIPYGGHLGAYEFDRAKKKKAQAKVRRNALCVRKHAEARG